MRLPFLAAVLCAASLAVSATPASAFFGALFGGWVGRTVVSYPTGYRPGTIVIRTSERRLYLVLGNGQALRYGIGVGRVGFTWSGVTTISAKREWPDWTPPAEMLARGPTCRATCAASRQPAWRARHVSGLGPVPYPWLERTAYHRHRDDVRLFPADQRRCHRPLQSRRGRCHRDRAVVSGQGPTNPVWGPPH